MYRIYNSEIVSRAILFQTNSFYNGYFDKIYSSTGRHYGHSSESVSSSEKFIDGYFSLRGYKRNTNSLAICILPYDFRDIVKPLNIQQEIVDNYSVKYSLEALYIPNSSVITLTATHRFKIKKSGFPISSQNMKVEAFKYYLKILFDFTNDCLYTLDHEIHKLPSGTDYATALDDLIKFIKRYIELVNKNN